MLLLHTCKILVKQCDTQWGVTHTAHIHPGHVLCRCWPSALLVRA